MWLWNYYLVHIYVTTVLKTIEHILIVTGFGRVPYVCNELKEI